MAFGGCAAAGLVAVVLLPACASGHSAGAGAGAAHSLATADATPGGSRPGPFTSAATPAPPPRWETIGSSLDGRPIEAVTLGRGRLRLAVIGGIHGDEAEAASALDPLRLHLHDRLASAPAAAAVYIVHDLNPDGFAAGTRGNARGVDLNRNWPTANFRASRRHGPSPLSEPETALLHAELERFPPDILVVLHSIASGPFVNYDGPAAEGSAAFTDAAIAATGDGRWHVRPTMGYATPGSLGTWAGVERQIPTLTIEFARGQDEASVTAALIAGIDALLEDAAGIGTIGK